MPVVRGDRIGESSKLNRCSVEAQDFYALFVSRVPDDFGRYRHSPSHVHIRMYPRREPSPAILRRVVRLMKELEENDLVKTWEADGVTFGEIVKHKPSGNLYHRTGEPPWSDHVHSKRCARTAIARAREWGTPDEAKHLARLIKKIDPTDVEGRSNGGRTEPDPPSPPSPPSPRITDSPPIPPARAGGDPANGSRPGVSPPGSDRRPLQQRRQVEEIVNAGVDHVVANGGRAWRGVRRRLREWVLAGCSFDEVISRIDAGEHLPRSPL